MYHLWIRSDLLRHVNYRQMCEKCIVLIPASPVTPRSFKEPSTVDLQSLKIAQIYNDNDRQPRLVDNFSFQRLSSFLPSRCRPGRRANRKIIPC